MIVSFFFKQERERILGRDARIAVDGAEKSHQSRTMAQASNADETETVRPTLNLPFRDRTHRQLWMEKKATIIRTRADPQGPASQAELAFHGVEYVVSVSSFNGDMLSIEVEQKQEGLRWRGDFTSRYIEDITTKTGNFKINWNQGISGQIVKPRGELEGVETGLGDLGVIVTAFHADKVPLYDVLEILVRAGLRTVHFWRTSEPG